MKIAIGCDHGGYDLKEKIKDLNVELIYENNCINNYCNI